MGVVLLVFFCFLRKLFAVEFLLVFETCESVMYKLKTKKV